MTRSEPPHHQSWTGRSVLVTGASRGIGRAIALRFAKAGATIHATARHHDDLAETATAILDNHGNVLSHQGDVTDRSFVERLFESIEAHEDRLWCTVNNAGIGTFGPIETLSRDDFETCLTTNLLAPFDIASRAIRLMRQQETPGFVINTGSVRSKWTERGDAGAYNASKAGLMAMTESMARQLHGDGSGMRIGIICPGWTNTRIMNPKGEPAPHLMTPETVADAAFYMASAPEGTNIFDMTIFPTPQKPW